MKKITFLVSLLSCICATTEAQVLHMFITAEDRHGGDFGQISGADAICNSDKNKPENTGAYKAVLVDSSNRYVCDSLESCDKKGSKDWVLQPNESYINANGEEIARTNEFSTIILDYYSKDDYSKFGAVWTGIMGNGSWIADPGGTCSNWINGDTSHIEPKRCHNNGNVRKHRAKLGFKGEMSYCYQSYCTGGNDNHLQSDGSPRQFLCAEQPN